jgi:hypothetical protein
MLRVNFQRNRLFVTNLAQSVASDLSIECEGPGAPAIWRASHLLSRGRIAALDNPPPHLKGTLRYRIGAHSYHMRFEMLRDAVGPLSWQQKTQRMEATS